MKKWDSICFFNISYSLATLSMCCETKLCFSGQILPSSWRKNTENPFLILFAVYHFSFSFQLTVYFLASHTHKPPQLTSWCSVMVDFTILLSLVERVFLKLYRLTLLSSTTAFLNCLFIAWLHCTCMFPPPWLHLIPELFPSIECLKIFFDPIFLLMLWFASIIFPSFTLPYGIFWETAFQFSKTPFISKPLAKHLT